MIFASLDIGTTSIRLSLWRDGDGKLISMEQEDLNIFYPKPSWVEQDPMEIINIITSFKGLDNWKQHNIGSLGITNQRESIVFWNKRTGIPLYNAIVWMDSRCNFNLSKVDRSAFEGLSSLPLSNYPSSSKIEWLFMNLPSALESHQKGDLLIGTIDSWVLWNLNGTHLTDPTNAHRTGFCSLRSPFEWNNDLISLWKGIPSSISNKCSSGGGDGGALPTISKGPYGFYKGIKISSLIGDQHASMLGHSLSLVGDVKITLGTGAFMMMISPSLSLLEGDGGGVGVVNRGLIGTIAYINGDGEILYGIEAAIGCASKAIDWLKNIGLLNDPINEIPIILSLHHESDIPPLFFPYLSGGSLSPRWKGDDMGSFHYLNINTTKNDIVIAVLEGIMFSIKECLSLMEEILPSPSPPCGKYKFRKIVVDGGLSACDSLMQLLSNTIDHPIIRPYSKEMTSLGAAKSAGLTIIEDNNNNNNNKNDVFYPIKQISLQERYVKWKNLPSRI